MLSFVCVYINGNESTIYTILKIDDLQWENNIRLKDAHNFSAPNITYPSLYHMAYELGKCTARDFDFPHSILFL